MVQVQQQRARQGATDGDAVSPAAVPRVLLRATGLTKSFGGRHVLRGVDVELRQGEVVLLRGDNGSGKTTLLNILSGNLAPDAGVIHLSANGSEEVFRFPRRWWQELNPADHFLPERVARKGVGRSWQDTRLFGSQTLLDNLAIAAPGQPWENPWRLFYRPSAGRLVEDANRRNALALLEQLGLGDRSESSADMVSLGQSKRIAFARCARANTNVLFLDEPLAGLDQTGMRDIVSFLGELAATHRLTLVVVEHVFNIPAILELATTVWTLRGGQLIRETVEQAKADPAIRNPLDLSAMLRRLAGMNVKVTEECLPRDAKLTRISRDGLPRRPLLTVRGLVAWRGHRPVLGEQIEDGIEGLDLTLHRGELVFLQAPNGWGKTSLLEALAGVLPSAQGAIRLDEKDLTASPTWERRRDGLAVIPARDNLFGSLTVSEFLRVTTTPASSAGDRAVPSRFSDHRSRVVASLSGGEQRQLVLHSALGQKAKVRIWDEPFSSLDAGSTAEWFPRLFPDSDAAGLVLVPSTHTLKER